ncbi:DUF4956 domain-containing protein [Actinotalea sp. M2MS4P-6]|uniref:DUF4956 domain-containing protein n=1 Tax=Actinotalea sp. M2MS4P-6 TaxID=2983762 RepID=UPI0021E38C37|nr:DUF4956 domain-containing protein [Actinotalea sp. M2MS4P-6]MCV2394943.1 DUF4956 domain-containing protein [Actinotalea sp. M2MS4P-6]
MPDLLLIAIDLVAVTLLAYGSYFRRHGRREMLVAYVGLNVGVLAVTSVLTNAAVGLGLGLGLFGVLSIVRLRSSEISHEEVAYYFASLALGLLFGLQPNPEWLAPVLAALVIGVVAAVDHLPWQVRARRQVITLDRVITDERELEAHLAAMLGAKIRLATVQSSDLVRDSMVIDVRYEVLPAGRRDPEVPTAAGARAAELMR